MTLRLINGQKTNKFNLQIIQYIIIVSYFNRQKILKFLHLIYQDYKIGQNMQI